MGRLVRTVVLVALLVPVSVLFVNVHAASAEKQSFADKERHGVQYLASLWQLTLALTDAQSATVAGRAPAQPNAISEAVAAISQVDDRLGDELRTHERWAGLRTKIEVLPKGATSDTSAAYTSYTEAAELLLALFAKVREESGLIRDPDADAYFLEDAVAEELPEATIAAGRLADLTLLAPTRPPSDRINTIARLIVVRTAVTDPAGDLADDVRSAVDGAKSRTLSGQLLSRLDLFERSMDKFTAVSAPGATEIAPDAAPVSSARTEMQGAAADLGDTILTEVDGLIVTRIDALKREQRFATGTLALAVLLVLVLIALTYLPSRRTGPDEQLPTEPGPPAAGAVRRPLVTTSAGSGLDADSVGQPGWGLSGAAR
jgi:hypothetical protein